MGGRGSSYGGGKISDSILIEKVYNAWMDDNSIASDIPTGLRILYLDDRKAGSKIGNSYDWEDGNSTGRQLNGTSTIQLQSIYTNLTRQNAATALNHIKHYHGMGDVVVMVKGTSSQRGEDLGELIIRNAKVVKIICKVDQLK